MIKINEATSIKEAFQDLIPESVSVVRGKVISAEPLQIKLVNDDKMILHENIICLPRHLTDYETKCDIKLGSGTLDSITDNTDKLMTFNVSMADIKIYNSLKVDEFVYILSFNQGKKYYILDRL